MSFLLLSNENQNQKRVLSDFHEEIRVTTYAFLIVVKRKSKLKTDVVRLKPD